MHSFINSFMHSAYSYWDPTICLELIQIKIKYIEILWYLVVYGTYDLVYFFKYVPMIQIWNEKMDQTQNYFIQSHDNLSLNIFIRMETKLHSCFSLRIEWYLFFNVLGFSLYPRELFILNNTCWILVIVQPHILEITGV